MSEVLYGKRAQGRQRSGAEVTRLSGEAVALTSGGNSAATASANGAASGAAPPPRPGDVSQLTRESPAEARARDWREEQDRLRALAHSRGGGGVSAHKVNRKYETKGEDPFADAAGLDTQGVAAAKNRDLARDGWVPPPTTKGAGTFQDQVPYP